MPSTRSGRTNTTSDPPQKSSPPTNKRKVDAISPASKDGGERPAKEQKTVEETLDKGQEAEVQPAKATESGKAEAIASSNGPGQNGHEETKRESEQRTTQTNGHAEEQKAEQTQPEQKERSETDAEMRDLPAEDNKDDVKSKEQVQDSEPSATHGTQVDSSQPSAPKDAVQEDKKREAAMPSNILEKGIIYFFTRGRVGIDEPENVQDLQRSFFVLRPIPQGGKITEGGVQDEAKNRLFALPKKVWPKSGRDRFMVFVEKANVTMSTLKDDFFQGSEYTTQTVGVRHTPPVSPLGEGVYAITTTGGGQGTTHLAYMLTIPEQPGQVQRDVGIAEKGSFVLSLKNPESSGPSYASLPEKPDYPKEFIDEFRGRGWMPVAPKHLDYANAQLLLIGEDFESSNNLEPKPQDQQDDKKETPAEELQKLEEEDEHRVDALKGDDTVFVDLGISKKEYSGILTTW